MGGVSPMTVKTVSQPDVFSTYAWIARDELSLSHDNQGKPKHALVHELVRIALSHIIPLHHIISDYGT
jgi:hypothetical protein